MKKGDIVKIYQKPRTKEDFEGEAKLIKKLTIHLPDMEYWEVQFKGETEHYARFIKVS